MNNELSDGRKRMKAIFLERRCSPTKYVGEPVGLRIYVKGSILYVHIGNVSRTSILFLNNRMFDKPDHETDESRLNRVECCFRRCVDELSQIVNSPFFY